MKKLNPYKHYVVRNDIMLEIDKKEIKENEPTLYIGSTPSTPPDLEFIFGYVRNGEFDWVNGEFSYEISYLYDDHSKNKLIEMSIDKIEKLHISDVMKSVLFEMNEIYWDYANYNPKHESHAFRVAEGIKMCMEIVKKHSS
jgi:hypothetical protein